MLLNQVKRLIINRQFVKYEKRLLHFNHSKSLYPLESRKLIKISGKESVAFLQGLITNDMRHFEEGSKSLYAMFLNNKGRVLFDTLIYKWDTEDTFLLECDKNISDLLQKHLKLFKLKRVINIEDIKDTNIWALISPNISPDMKLKNNEINIYKDPRLSDLGYRVLSKASYSGQKLVEALDSEISLQKDDNSYKYLRYSLGVSEGAQDHPPGTCFPLEINCDYLHGVSFHKGCYVGQELTARVHHTGVVRKRIMPIKFKEEVKVELEKDLIVSDSNNSKSNLGKLKACCQNYGIGLIRIKEALDAKELKIGGYSAKVLKPSWWPVEAPKDRTTIKVD